MKFESTKCKRCGFYEEDRITSDDVFDEWEFCPSDFKSDDGRYIRTKDKEFNATFLCPECVKKGIFSPRLVCISCTLVVYLDVANLTGWDLKSKMSFSSMRFGHFCDFRPKVCFIVF
ncbi:hypothetical protein HanOQP8_Chr01g0033331 [Helianthus annuus]|nr:hypothetical protein HanOQP8_Chr01g0033331 [Helianthus annuus]